MKKLIGIVLTLLFVTGCTVGPNYHRQDVNMPSRWTGKQEPLKDTSDNTELVRWWTKFNDPNLTSLIERAMNTNLDLLVAQARIQQAREARNIAAGGLWPEAAQVALILVGESRFRAILVRQCRHETCFKPAWMPHGNWISLVVFVEVWKQQMLMFRLQLKIIVMFW